MSHKAAASEAFRAVALPPPGIIGSAEAVFFRNSVIG
jgi:hypothetical protein